MAPPGPGTCRRCRPAPRGQQALDAPTWALYGATIRTSSEGDRVGPVQVDPAGPSPTFGERRGRRPLPRRRFRVEPRRSGRGRGGRMPSSRSVTDLPLAVEVRLRLQSVVVEDLGGERGTGPGWSRQVVARNRPRSGGIVASPSRRAPAPNGPRRAGGCHGAAGRAAADRRGARSSARRLPSTRRSRATSGRPRRRTARRPTRPSRPTPTARTCPRQGSRARRRAAPACRRGSLPRITRSSSRIWSGSPRWTTSDVDVGPGSPVDLLDQVADHLVAVRGDADPFPVREQPADHPRAAIRLARTRRSLDREHRPVELEREPERGIEVGLLRPPERFAGEHPGPRRPTDQQVADRAIGAVGVDPVVRDPCPRAPRVQLAGRSSCRCRAGRSPRGGGTGCRPTRAGRRSVRRRRSRKLGSLSTR